VPIGSNGMTVCAAIATSENTALSAAGREAPAQPSSMAAGADLVRWASSP
jgi:hypothetical protein